MLIGVPKEIKKQEHRVGLIPSSVREMVTHGHQVMVETGAGAGIGFDDAAYINAGARIAMTAADIFKSAEMIIKVKEPQPEECAMLRPDQILFTYLHLAADKPQAEALIKSNCVAIAYETVMGANGKGLPLLAPMSEVAGRLSVQVGAHYLMKHMGGEGILIGGVPGTPAGRVLVLGGGVAGFNAARVAVGMGARVTILDKSPERLRELDEHFNGSAEVLYSTTAAIETLIPKSDLVIGAVLVPGASAPRLVTRSMLKTMKKGSVMVDIAIDQGGCFETSHPTTHGDPVYDVDGVIHYCVANMPGAVPKTSAMALNHAILPYALKIADMGWERALASDAGLAAGLNISKGKVMHKAVAGALHYLMVAE
ncbi:MAG: alanine dehydrogenase [Alphaproteobacteria bacterium RIFCSPHIGHO2_02_FULL_46_13]|nr:MAG: alanine dehydrogenase [Alphaproteobacteria bacterium RIFCSPHIGHO2_02_FULL_46_13]